MSDPDTTPPTGDRARVLSILLPVVALLVGLLLGGLIVGVGTDGSDGDTDDAEPTPTQAAEPSPTDVVVTVPAECLAAVETVQEATALIRENLTNIREFRSGQIVDMLNELEDLDSLAREQAQTCREVDLDSPAASPDEQSPADETESPTAE